MGYLSEHGVLAHRQNLQTWLELPAQKLQYLEASEAVHSNASGEFALRRMQEGARLSDVVKELRSEYLVEASERLLASYRLYREQKASYWTLPLSGIIGSIYMVR